MPDKFLDQLRSLYADLGSRPYSGEAVTQIEHALQTAALAETSGASDALVAAALLHDLGHIVALPSDINPKRDDDLHQFRALPMLRHTFPEEVTAPIRLHVDAKRYLCSVDRQYIHGLSPVSVNSLMLQGGAYSQEGARTFILKPHAEDAVKLRRWDDAAKVPGLQTPPLEYFLQYVERSMQRPA